MKRDPLLAVALAWVIPGLGHLYLGRPKKALFFFLILAATYIFGYILADFRFVRFDDNPFYFVGRWGSGLVWAATWLVEKNPPAGRVSLDYYEPGLLYMCSVGLLNVVLILNVLSAQAKDEAAAVESSASPELPPAGPAPDPRA